MKFLFALNALFIWIDISFLNFGKFSIMYFFNVFYVFRISFFTFYYAYNL